GEAPAATGPCQELCEFASRGDLDGCRLLLRGGRVEDLNWRRPSDGNSALHLAAEEGHETVVRLLVAAGASPETKNAFGLKPIALVAPDTEVYKMLDVLTAPMEAVRRAAVRK
ncbi:unnamed protein product, partial [Prorocentrum cordatum]